MFQVKICGITSVEDAVHAVEAGADAVGLNFWPKSKRFVALDVAADVSRAVAGRALRVGVFVDARIPEILGIANQLQLDLVQLHGEEPPEVCRELMDRGVIRAFRYRDSSDTSIREYLNECRPRLPDAVLIDGYAPGEMGGTGQCADWESLARNSQQMFPGLPWILAGGLNAGNVEQAVRVARPTAVDTASGVETSPGKKDPRRVEAFVHNARRALKILPST